MRSKFLLGGMVLILLVVNGLILSKEQQLTRARRVVLELAPVDPRSLIQGDYMRLSYVISRTLATQGGGTAFLELDSDDIARSAHPDFRPGRQKLRYRVHNGQAEFGASSFLFQEGRRTHYEQARFGELRIDFEGRATLVNLLDQDQNPL